MRMTYSSGAKNTPASLTFSYLLGYWELLLRQLVDPHRLELSPDERCWFIKPVSGAILPGPFVSSGEPGVSFQALVVDPASPVHERRFELAVIDQLVQLGSSDWEEFNRLPWRHRQRLRL
jgi:hypothetical protein